MFINDPEFGRIVDFDQIRKNLKHVYDALHPDFDLLGSLKVGSDQYDDEPSYMIAAGASMLAWMMLLAAEEHEVAEELKNSIFTLGWTEEAIGSDLLSVQTQATPVSDDPDEREYYLKGGKWLINNSHHADYHMVLAKVDPTQDGPRSLSLFLVPRSSTKNWQRLETHVLKNMVLTKFDIDGPGRLMGKRGHGLSIVQRMAMPSKYQCSYVGMRMVREAIPATIAHLSTKRIFGDNPINFSNVFRQLYNLSLQAAFLQFVFYRAVALSDGGFLQFHGTMLKSWMLLRGNELLSQNLLVAGSKGFLKESVIGRDAIDSFVLPVFDGHYTINTLMTAKHMPRYLNATGQADPAARVKFLRETMYGRMPGDPINTHSRDLRHPDFFDYAAYIKALELPLPLDAAALIQHVRDLMANIESRGLGSDAEHRYKIGVIVHWLEALLAACEMWKVMGDDLYLNVVVQQHNALVNAINDIVSEGQFDVPFLLPMRHLPLPEVNDPQAFLLHLQDIQGRLESIRGEREAAR